MISVFHTSAEAETKLEDMYQKHIQQKQNKLDETARKTGVIPKYNALVLVKQPCREFYVGDVSAVSAGMGDRSVYYKSHDTFIKAPKEAEVGGGTYKLEPGLLRYVELFQSRHKTFRVVFEPSIYYCAGMGVCRATLYSIPIPGTDDDMPEILNVEIQDNYEI